MRESMNNINTELEDAPIKEVMRLHKMANLQ